MWWSERVRQVQQHRGPVVFVAPSRYGVGHFLQALTTPEKPLVWIELAVTDVDDVSSQGNKLAEAINRTFDGNLLSYGLPFAYNLNVLKTLHSVTSPSTFALTEAHHASEFATALLELSSPTCQVVVQFDTLPKKFAVPKTALVISKDDLKLTVKDGLELAEGRVSKKEVQTLLEKTNHAYDHFLAELHQQLQLPPHLVPGPTGPRMLPGYEVEMEPATLLKVLVKRKRWLEALELAAHKLPERVPKILEEAGHAYHEQGLHKRLFALLEALPEEVKGQENVLYWRLQAAFRLGREQELRDETTTFLETNEAPELRALYAGVFAPTNRKEALRAYKTRATAFTAFQLGRLTVDNIDRSVEILLQSIKIAEETGKAYEIVRNASELTSKLIFKGHYQKAVSFGDWAIREFDKLSVKDGQRRLQIINDWAYARILCGEMTGLEIVLTTNESALKLAYPDLAYLFRSTLADFLVATSQPNKALIYCTYNFKNAPTYSFADATLSMTRALIEIGDYKEALNISGQTFEIKDKNIRVYQPSILLAYGMALSLVEVAKANRYLTEAEQYYKNYHYSAHRLAQVTLYLAFIEFKQGNTQKARSILCNPNNHVIGLAESGLRLLSGPENEFRPVWNLLKGESVPLELRLLGESEVWYEGEKIKLHPQQLEILAVLASRKKPVTLEELLSDLYGDGGNKQTLKSVLSRLRQVVPVISQHPYQLTVKYQADFLELLEHVKQGQLQDAMKLYKGQLLKGSDAPYIRDKDLEISEALQQLALAKGEAETLLQLSEYFPDDLRLWERAEQTLQKSDPRAFLLRTRLHQVRASFMN